MACAEDSAMQLRLAAQHERAAHLQAELRRYVTEDERLSRRLAILRDNVQPPSGAAQTALHSETPVLAGMRRQLIDQQAQIVRAAMELRAMGDAFSLGTPLARDGRSSDAAGQLAMDGGDVSVRLQLLEVQSQQLSGALQSARQRTIASSGCSVPPSASFWAAQTGRRVVGDQSAAVRRKDLEKSIAQLRCDVAQAGHAGVLAAEASCSVIEGELSKLSVGADRESPADAELAELGFAKAVSAR